jgi:UDP-2,4-diacetamido-2,4,6-trideoxy-beta-L-altropyranose hydrolase
MRIAIRTDSSHRIGAGHVMRCLTIAKELRIRGAEVLFLCRDLPGNCIGLIRDQAGFAVAVLSRPSGSAAGSGSSETVLDSWLGTDWAADLEDVSAALAADGSGPGKRDWLVVDHYSLDHRWEIRAREFAARILALDDIADRRHDCDALIDQNYYPDAASRYRGKVPTGCNSLLGPEFALLRPEFHAAAKFPRRRDGSVRRIHVFYGGADPTDETGKAIAVLAGLGRPGLEFDIVVGGLNPRRDRIREACRELPNATFHCDVQNMAELEDRADLCLGAGGTATWERSLLGLPAITTIIADNQAETTLAVAAIGAISCIGHAREATPERLRAALEDLIGRPEAVLALSAKARALMERTREPADIVALAFGLEGGP